MTNINLQNGFILGSVFKNSDNAKLLDYTVTFKSNNELFYISSCNRDSSISAPPEPTSASGSFVGWYSNYHEDIIDFPYSPDDNDTMIAQFRQTRSELEWTTSGVWYDGYTGSSVRYQRTKINEELTINAQVMAGNIGYQYKKSIMLGYTETSVLTEETISSGYNRPVTYGNFNYDGRTIYYCFFDNSENRTSEHDTLIPVTSISTDAIDIGKVVLDYYFMKS